MAKSQFSNFGVVSSDIDKPFSERELAYIAARSRGVLPKASALEAGYSQGSAYASLEDRPKIQAAIARNLAINAQQAQLTRQDIIDGIKKAIDDAVMLADPQAQIAGWKELGKLCGLYAPEVKELHLSMTASKMQGRLAQMSEDELLELAASTAKVVQGEVLQ